MELLSLKEILDISESSRWKWVKRHKWSCIYFLINESNIVYIWQTKNLRQRIKWNRADKNFSEVSSISIWWSKEHMTWMETLYILKYRPIYNNYVSSLKHFSREEDIKKFMKNNWYSIRNGISLENILPFVFFNWKKYFSNFMIKDYF